MNYESLEEEVLDDNNLNTTIKKFKASGDLVWHISRHPIDVDRDFPDVGMPYLKAELLLGLALLKSWAQSIDTSDSLFISEPYLVVDVAWLNGFKDGSPPYVYICLAKNKESFQPVVHYELTDRDVGVDLGISLSAFRTKYLGEDKEEGAWLFFFKE